MLALKPLSLKKFGFEAGEFLASKYEVLELLGTGWEGEVYRIRERGTRIERAAKFFFPRRNPRNRAARFYARKLHKLRHCPILVQYHTRETIQHHGSKVTFLVSDYVEGELLSQYVSRQPGRRLSSFQGLHLLHALATGLEPIHNSGDYHGDLHSDNVIVRQQGLSYEVKLVDMYYWGSPSAENIREDVCKLIRVFYDSIGGIRHYARQPLVVKDICCGLKRSLINRKFKSAGDLRRYLENIRWGND